MKFNPRHFRKCKIFRETIGSGAVGSLRFLRNKNVKPCLKLRLARY